MNARKTLAAWAVAATLLTGGGRVFADAFPFPSATPFAGPYATEDRDDDRDERESDLYEEGTDAIDDENWN